MISIDITKRAFFGKCLLLMFRNVTGAQEAVVHRQSLDSLLNGSKPIRLIKDIQSDDIAETYSDLKNKWRNQREHLIEHLKQLEKHKKQVTQDIQQVKNLIYCLDVLINNGQIDKNCQELLNDTNQSIQPAPETYALRRKSLGNRSIRLTRHSSKTMLDDASYSAEKISSKTTLAEQVVVEEDAFFLL